MASSRCSATSTHTLTVRSIRERVRVQIEGNKSRSSFLFSSVVVFVGVPWEGGLPTIETGGASCSHEYKSEKSSWMAADKASLLSLLSRSVSNRAH